MIPENTINLTKIGKSIIFANQVPVDYNELGDLLATGNKYRKIFIKYYGMRIGHEIFICGTITFNYEWYGKNAQGMKTLTNYGEYYFQKIIFDGEKKIETGTFTNGFMQGT